MSVNLEFERREEVGKWTGVVAPILTILASLLVGAVALVMTGANPIDAYTYIFLYPLSSFSGVQTTLIRAVPITLAGLAVYIPYKAGLWNIGAEGQLYVGAIVATWIGTSVSAQPVVLLTAMFVLAGLAGGAWGFIPGYLRAKLGVNEIIVTLLMTFVAFDVNEYLIRGPLQGTPGFPASDPLPPEAVLPSLGELVPFLGSFDVHVGLFIALGAVGLVYVAERKTKFGYEMRLVDANPNAAKQSGVSLFWTFVLSMSLAGVLAGAAGMIELSGVQGKLQSGFSPGYGFTAIPIALLGRKGAFRVLLASLFFALLFVGSATASIRAGVPASILDVIQALVILFLITGEFFKRYRIAVNFGRDFRPGRA